MRKSEGHIKTKVSVRISRYYSDVDGVSLFIDDELSGLCIAKVDIENVDEIFNLFTGCIANGDAKVYRDSFDRLGKQIEVQTVHIPLDEYTSAAVSAAAKEAERLNPGWLADSDTAFNRHRLVDGKYAITLRRWT